MTVLHAGGDVHAECPFDWTFKNSTNLTFKAFAFGRKHLGHMAVAPWMIKLKTSKQFIYVGLRAKNNQHLLFPLFSSPQQHPRRRR